MHAEKNQLAEHGNEVLFQDKYGILQLAANVTLTRTPKLPKRIHYLCIKPLQWASSVRMAISQLWENNNITLSNFMWIEPTDFMHKLLWQARIKKDE